MHLHRREKSWPRRLGQVLLNGQFYCLILEKLVSSAGHLPVRPLAPFLPIRILCDQILLEF